MRVSSHPVPHPRQHTFTPIPEFQLVPLPSTNPILLGHRWKEYHLALGPNLNKIHEQSWEIFKQEKRDNMVSPGWRWGCEIEEGSELILRVVARGSGLSYELRAKEG